MLAGNKVMSHIKIGGVRGCGPINIRIFTAYRDGNLSEYF